jgi:hypothetical protein
MARRKTAVDWDRLEEEEALSFSEDEEQEERPRQRRERYEVMVRFVLKTDDPDTAEDMIADFLTESVAEFADNYKPEVIVVDYTIESVDPAEL